jgi:hypothetical protein
MMMTNGFHHTDITSKHGMVRCWDFAYAQYLAEELERDHIDFVMVAVGYDRPIVWQNTMRIPHGNTTNVPKL